MKIGIVGSTRDQVSLPFDAQRAINLYPVFDKEGKEIAAMAGTPGYYIFTSLGSDPVREEFASATGRAFAVAGTSFYEIDSAGTKTLRGTLLTSAGKVYIEENASEIGIVDGQYMYVMDFATNTFAQVVGGRSYVTNGDFAVGTGWTLGTGWSITGGSAKAIDATADMSQTSPVTLVVGQSYILTYTLSGVSYVTNGDFSVGTGWTLGADWSIASGKAIATPATNTDISQTTPETIVSGQDYLVTISVTRTGGSFVMSLGGGAAGAAINSNGTFTQTLTAGATQIFLINATAFKGTVDSISITITPTGDLIPKIGGTDGIKRINSGTYVETIIAGATQDVIFSGASFTGKIDNVTIVDQSFGLPSSVGTLTYSDSFFIVNKNGTGRLYKSAPNQGRVWDALDFANAESSPDNLLRPIAAVGQLFNMGKFTGEIWTNTGASSFPFQKVAGGKINMGILAPATARELDNTLFWVGRNTDGYGGVYRASGFIPLKISDESIDAKIKAATDPENLRSYSYEGKDGHLFYVVTGGGLATTLVYDLNTKMWHERAYMNSQGALELHRPQCHMSIFSKALVGDRLNGNIYILDSSTYTDNGDPLPAIRIYTHLSDESKRIRYNSLVIGAESGVGLQSGQGSDPVIEMQLSTDGAKTWSDTYREPLGKTGEYKNKAQFRRLGVAEIMTFKVQIVDPVKRYITGSYLT